MSSKLHMLPKTEYFQGEKKKRQKRKTGYAMNFDALEKKWYSVVIVSQSIKNLRTIKIELPAHYQLVKKKKILVILEKFTKVKIWK